MSSTKRFSLLLALVGLIALGFVIFDYDGDSSREAELQADYRAPVANPPVEPDRPDLFEEPTIAPECQPTASDTC